MSNAQVFSKVSYGSAVLEAGTKQVADPDVSANSNILLTLKTAGGTVAPVSVSAVVAGTGFTILSTSNVNTSTYNYVIFN
jgi:hypothetical protein